MHDAKLLSEQISNMESSGVTVRHCQSKQILTTHACYASDGQVGVTYGDCQNHKKEQRSTTHT